MRELSDVMADAVAARARSMSGLTPTEPRLAAVKNLVRRHRASRHAVQLGASVAGLVVFGAAAWFGLFRPEPAPVATPDVTHTPTPTPSPTPTVRYLSTVTVDPLLPSAERLPEGLLAETDADWTLLRYEARPVATDGERRVSVEYLLSPDGNRYQLPDHPGRITGWVPGSTRAVATQTSDDVSASLGLVDLETGSWYPVDVNPVLTLHDMTAQDLLVWVWLAPNGTDLYVILEPWDEGATVSLSLLDPVTGRATDPFDVPAGARSLSVSPDGSHLLTWGGGLVTVASTTGDQLAVADLPGCTPSYAWWLSSSVWSAACAWGVPEDVDNFYAVHSLDGQVWGVPNDGGPALLTATGDVAWAVVDMVSDAGFAETLLRVSRDGGAEPFTLAEAQLQYSVPAPGRLFATTDTDNPDHNGSGAVSAPLYAVDLDRATTRLVVPEPEGAEAWVTIIGGSGGSGLWHYSDGTWESAAD